MAISIRFNLISSKYLKLVEPLLNLKREGNPFLLRGFFLLIKLGNILLGVSNNTYVQGGPFTRTKEQITTWGSSSNAPQDLYKSLQNIQADNWQCG